jgi:hypothetical protein
MAFSAQSDLHAFPECERIVASLVLGYSELEVIMVYAMGPALNVHMADAVRMLFRTRSEANRLDIADAAMRPFFADHGQGDAFTRWVGAMRHCKNIRNQYAHAFWGRNRDGLFFNNLDAVAKTIGGPITMVEYGIDLPLLQEQERFFEYTSGCLAYLAVEARRLRDRRRRHRLSMPKAMLQPKLHNRQR